MHCNESKFRISKFTLKYIGYTLILFHYTFIQQPYEKINKNLPLIFQSVIHIITMTKNQVSPFGEEKPEVDL
jgi:hypothetical protein